MTEHDESNSSLVIVLFTEAENTPESSGNLYE